MAHGVPPEEVKGVGPRTYPPPSPKVPDRPTGCRDLVKFRRCQEIGLVVESLLARWHLDRSAERSESIDLWRVTDQDRLQGSQRTEGQGFRKRRGGCSFSNNCRRGNDEALWLWAVLEFDSFVSEWIWTLIVPCCLLLSVAEYAVIVSKSYYAHIPLSINLVRGLFFSLRHRIIQLKSVILKPPLYNI